MLVLIYSPPAPDSCSSPLGLVFPVLLWATWTFWCLVRLQSSPLHKSYWCFVWLSDQGLVGGCRLPHDRSWLTTPVWGSVRDCTWPFNLKFKFLLSCKCICSPANQILCARMVLISVWKVVFRFKLHCWSNHMYMWLSLSMIDVDLRPRSLIVWPEA